MRPDRLVRVGVIGECRNVQQQVEQRLHRRRPVAPMVGDDPAQHGRKLGARLASTPDIALAGFVRIVLSVEHGADGTERGFDGGVGQSHDGAGDYPKCQRAQAWIDIDLHACSSPAAHSSIVSSIAGQCDWIMPAVSAGAQRRRCSACNGSSVFSTASPHPRPSTWRQPCALLNVLTFDVIAWSATSGPTRYKHGPASGPNGTLPRKTGPCCWLARA